MGIGPQVVSGLGEGPRPATSAALAVAADTTFAVKISLSQGLEHRGVLPDIPEALFPDASCQERQIAAGIDLAFAGEEDEALGRQAAPALGRLSGHTEVHR